MFDFLKKKKEPKSLKDILIEFEILKKDLKKISKEIEVLKSINEFNIQKVGILRYNPFHEMGSDQSFSIAILDGNDNGVVITSLYSREGNKVFAKPIKKGKSEYILTEEEEKVIKLAKDEREKARFTKKTTGSGNFGSH